MEIKQSDVDEAVVEFCVEVIQNPLMHFNESDLHFLLCDTLNRKFNNELRKNSFDTDLNSVINGSNSNYQTCLLHLEYGANKGRAMDIVIFDEKSEKRINHHNLQHNNGSDSEYLRPKFGFELGTEKIGLTDDSIKEHMENDIEKLKDPKHGYLIHIIRDTNKGERKDKMKILKDRFKTPIENLDKTSSIKVISILIYLFRKQNEVRCEIFNPNVQDLWTPLRDGDLKDKDEIKKIIRSTLQLTTSSS